MFQVAQQFGLICPSRNLDPNHMKAWDQIRPIEPRRRNPWLSSFYCMADDQVKSQGLCQAFKRVILQPVKTGNAGGNSSEMFSTRRLSATGLGFGRGQGVQFRIDGG